MTENPIEPTTTQPTTEPAPEPVVSSTPESAPAVDASPLTADEPETEVEVKDEENIEKPENQFDDLDEELVDVHESADTIWLLRRVGMGILKVVIILGAIGLLIWLIWGDSENIKSELEHAREVNIEDSVKDLKDKLQHVIPEKKFKEDFPIESKQNLEPKTVTNSVLHIGGLNLASWNYWMESQRINAQAGTPGDVMRWKRDAEIFFEIPLPDQIAGNNSIERSHKISKMLTRLSDLLYRSDDLLATLSTEIKDYTARANYAQELSLASEQKFLDAMKASDPTNIGAYLNQKAEAEKNLQKYAVAAEGRRIFVDKVSEYQAVLENVQTAVTVNREALIQDIQVVSFPADPFGRVINLEQWQPSLK